MRRQLFWIVKLKLLQKGKNLTIYRSVCWELNFIQLWCFLKLYVKAFHFYWIMSVTQYTVRDSRTNSTKQWSIICGLTFCHSVNYLTMGQKCKTKTPRNIQYCLEWHSTLNSSIKNSLFFLLQLKSKSFMCPVCLQTVWATWLLILSEWFQFLDNLIWFHSAYVQVT